MSAGEVEDVCRFVNNVFDRSVAAHCSEKGRRSFREYADPEAMSHRIRTDHFVLLGEEDGRLSGMIEVRGHRHVSLLFVDLQQQGRGLGHALLQRAVEICQAEDPNVREITVNSSPNAVEIYERMGFDAIGREQSIKGVRSTPMKLRLS